MIHQTSDPRALEPIIGALTMPEVVASDAKWQYDYIVHYNLDKEIISGYLKSIWGNYKFFVEVSHVSGIEGFPRPDSFTASRR